MEYPHYQPRSDHRPLDDAELDELDGQLADLPAAMNVELLDGYLTGLLMAPTLVETLPGRAWLPAVWGGDAEEPGDPAPFVSNKQRKRLVMLVLRHLHDIDTRLRQRPQDWEPVFSVAALDEDEVADDGPAELADAQDWCAGFLDAVALDPEAWDTLWSDADLGPALAPIGLLGGAADEAGDGDADEDDDDEAADTADADDELTDADAYGTDDTTGDLEDDDGPDADDADDLLDDPHEVDRLSRAAAEAVLLLNQRRLRRG